MRTTALALAATILITPLASAEPTVSTFSFFARAMSADGRVIVGADDQYGGEVYYWSAQTGSVNLGRPFGAQQATAMAVSGDGSVITGMGTAAPGFISWVWTQQSGFIPVTVPNVNALQATCISRDGLTVGGAATDASHFYKAFVWTQQDGGRLIPQGSNYSTWLHALSPTGLRTCGSGASSVGTWPALWGSTYVWCERIGPITSYTGGVALAMTPDLSTVVGYVDGATNLEPFVWTHGSVTVIPFGLIGGRLEGVSDDGRIAVGGPFGGLVWLRDEGLMDSDTFFAQYGLSIHVTELVAISANGRVFCSPHAVIDLGACGSADFNHDGSSGTDADIEAFFNCIAGNCCGFCDSADFNSDGDSATDQDIEAFFRVLGGGAC